MVAAGLYGVTAVAVAVSWKVDPERTRRGLRVAARSLASLAPRVLGMVALVGLILALAPPEAITRLFSVHGIGGFVLVAAIGSIMTMPGPVAFPLAGSLLRLGASPGALATFITTLTMVGVVTAPMEISSFGRRFTVTRQALSFATAVLIGLAMGELL